MPGYLWTGQTECYGSDGEVVSCNDSGQDGALQDGLAWPAPRFVVMQEIVHDRPAGLYWLKGAGAISETMNWEEGMQYIKIRLFHVR